MPDLPLISALGCAVRVDTTGVSDVDAAAIARAWEDAAWADDALPVAHRTVPAPAHGSLADRLSVLSQQVTLTAIEARRGDLWMLHAAAVADDDGRVIAVIGPSGRGKTTASRALGATFGYVTDETVAIDRDGRVFPYRKPLSVIEQAGAVKAQHAPGDLGLQPLPDVALRLSALVLLDRQPDGPEQPVVTKCDLGEVLGDIVEQTSYLADLPAPLQTIAALVAAVGGIHRVTYREAVALPDALAPLLRDPDAVLLGTPPPPAVPAHDGSGVYRGAHIDVLPLSDPDRVALLQPQRDRGAILRVVSGIGPALWRAAGGVSAETLVSAATDAYGTPEHADPAALVAAAIAELVADGVLATEPTWRVREDVAWTGKRGSFVALPLTDFSRLTPVALDESAGTVWAALTGGPAMTASALVDVVAVMIGTEPAAIEGDVRSFLADLQNGLLVEPVAP